MPSLLDPPIATLPVQDDATKARILAQNTKAAVAQIRAFPYQEQQRRAAAAAAELQCKIDVVTQQFSLFWDNAEMIPGILAGMGTDAVQLFQLADTEIAELEAARPGCTAAILSRVKPTTRNVDGTVTLNT